MYVTRDQGFIHVDGVYVNHHRGADKLQSCINQAGMNTKTQTNNSCCTPVLLLDIHSRKLAIMMINQ